MSRPGVSAGALKMAWKMVDTIFPRHAVRPADADRLLNLIGAVSLEHLLDSRRLRWTAPARSAGQLRFDGRRVRREDAQTPVLKARYLPDELDAILEEAEALLDRYELDEDEKATLFTALPCLGLAVLQDGFVEWLEEPPFGELG